MTSKQEPYKLHAAIFPSLAAITATDGESMLVTNIEGSYSKLLHTDFSQTKSKFIKQVANHLTKFFVISWKNEQSGDAVTAREILRDLKLNGVQDVILQKITFAIPWTQFNNSTLQNESFYEPWTFKPQTFRKGIWKRLKALDNYPGKELYEKYCRIKEDLAESLDQSTRKRWRDAILMNDPKEHANLDNAEFRSFWTGKRCALILKESRGKFDLMDLGEWRA